MKHQDSDYQDVAVTMRDNSVIRLNVSNGLRLMAWLARDEKSATHVSLTRKNGHPIVVRVTDILTVEPILTVEAANKTLVPSNNLLSELVS